QINVAINAAPLIPPAFPLARIHAHRDDVLAANLRQFGDVVRKRSVTARMTPQKFAVQPDLAVAENTVEIQPQYFALVGFWNGKILAVPADRVRQVAVVSNLAVRRVGVSSVQNIIVREPDLLPRGIIKRGGNDLVA